MIFDWNRCCCADSSQDFAGPGELTLPAGLWVGVLSSGECIVEGGAPGHTAAGHSGDLLLGCGPLQLRAAAACHMLTVRLQGLAAQEFAKGVPLPCFVSSEGAPRAAELLARLCDGSRTGSDASRTAYALLCELAPADEAPRRLPPLVEAAVAAIRDNYMALYGVEELSAQLGVSKCHLVRVFSAAMGMPPGRYLLHTRIEAAKLLLAEQEYSLDTIANLCGFSGANYLCRVFKKETGQTPAAWRSTAPKQSTPALPRRNQEVFV